MMLYFSNAPFSEDVSFINTQNEYEIAKRFMLEQLSVTLDLLNRKVKHLELRLRKNSKI